MQLKFGLTIDDPEGRLARFCREEYAYYDGIHTTDPNHIEPLDVLVTLSVNSFIRDAARVRTVHRELARQCDPLLPAIPETMSLLEPGAVQTVESLLHAAVQAPGVLIPVATKVLHRKRRELVPMLDNVVIERYLKSLERPDLFAQTQDKRRAASTASVVLSAFREDLSGVSRELAASCGRLAASGFILTPVRALEILVWTEVEPREYYRNMFNLYIIADRGIFDSDGAWLDALAAVAHGIAGRAGVGLQVRIKDRDAADRARLARDARVLLDRAGVAALLNGTTAEALAAGYAGVHWPEASIPSRREPLPPGFVVGASVHSLAALRRAEAAGAGFAAFAPVFDPGSKMGNGVGLDALREVAAAARIPVLALGGVTPERAPACLAAGASGVAAVTGVMRAPDAAAAVDAYLAAVAGAATLGAAQS